MSTNPTASQRKAAFISSCLVMGLVGCGSSSPFNKKKAGTDSTTTSATPPTPTGGGATGTATYALAAKLMLADSAQSIVITSADVTKLQPGQIPSQFYSVAPSGQLSKLAVFVPVSGAASLADLSPPAATAVYQNATYFIFFFKNSMDSSCSMVVADKSSGALYCGGTETIESTVNTANAPLVQWDAAGNMYLAEDYVGATGYSQVVKFLLSSSAAPQKTQVTSESKDGIGVGGFLVDPSGDVMVYAGGSNSDGGSKIYKANGGIQNIDGAHDVAAFLGLDKNFYYYEFGSTSVFSAKRQADGTFNTALLSSTAVLAASADAGAAGLGGTCQTSTEVYGGPYGSTSAGIDISALYTSPKPMQIAQQGISSWTALNCGPHDLYVLGEDAAGDSLIKAYDEKTTAWISILPAGDFSIDQFQVNAAGVVFFTGLRNSDGAKVYASIAQPGSAPTILSTSFPSVTSLLPL